MPYELAFSDKAKREWDKLDSTVRSQFQKVLVRRLADPKVPSARLRGKNERYKIKLRSVGYRLLYEVHDRQLLVLVIAVGRRDSVYDDLD
jgi:mRNA interferase RelE/StbE